MLSSEKCKDYCLTLGDKTDIENDVTLYVRWTPNVPLILGIASEGDNRINWKAKESDRTSTHKNRQMCETDLSCRELALAWKLLSIVLNSALS